jgi:glycosyltransferase involved in cell wall biosynthesis
MIIDNKPDIIIFPSQFTFDTYLKNNFFKNSAKEILYNCIEPIKVELSKNLSDEYFNILYVGQLSQHKGVHVLIEAFKNLAYEKSKLHIVGDGDYESNLKKIAGGDTRIVFYGKVSNLDMGRFYHLADITVMPSLCQEVLGIVILESFSAGVPVIGSRIGGIPELIKDGHNGFIFKPGNHEELKSILEKIIFKRELLQQLKINALDSSRRFGIDAHIAGLEEIYKKAMGLNRSHITN